MAQTGRARLGRSADSVRGSGVRERQTGRKEALHSSEMPQPVWSDWIIHSESHG